MNYIINNNAIVLSLSTGRVIRIQKEDSKYASVLQLFALPADEQENALLELLNKVEQAAPTLQTLQKKGLEVDLEARTVVYDGEALPPALVTKILSIVRDGLPLEHFENFWKRLRLNPSSVAVRELMDFMAFQELPLTEDGCFLAYKGVGEDFFSIHGNTNTTVLTGVVKTTGHIYNGIGEVVEVLRRDVDDDRNNGCSHGLHVGSMAYAKGWGPKVVIVKVDPKDVVSIPHCSSYQKCRVCKYEVVDFYVQEITDSVVSADGKGRIISEENTWKTDSEIAKDEREQFISRVANYLEKKFDAGHNKVYVREIQKSFSPIWPSREEIFDALQMLFYPFEKDEKGAWAIYNNA